MEIKNSSKILAEFYDNYNKVHGTTNVSFNKIKAADIATSLLIKYKKYISVEDLNSVKNKVAEINEYLRGDTTVLFGYTSSGLHIVALMDRLDNAASEYEPICNLVRGDPNETKLFSDMILNNGCFSIDIYIEDLRNIRDSFEVKVDTVGINGEKLIFTDEIKEISDNTKHTLKKYKRKLESKDGTYNNKTWRLIAADKFINFLRVTVDNENIELLGMASDKYFYDDEKAYTSGNNKDTGN